MNKILKELHNIGIIPVVVLEDAKDAEALGKALWEGGLSCAEVTFRTTAAKESISILTDKYPDMLVGAGTVLTTWQVDQAIDAGAKFIVSPGLNPKIVRYCQDKGIPIIPGCVTPSEIEQAIELGLEAVKFFPAEQAGGLEYIKAISAPYPNILFMPTGGINPENVKKYLAAKSVFACGGSWMVKGGLIKAGDFEKIKELSEEAVRIVAESRLY